MIKNKNDSPRNKIFDILRDIFLEESLSKFPNDFINSLQINEDYYHLNIIVKDGEYYYKGYPRGNFLQIISKVISLWNDKKSFPIRFFKIIGLKDETNNTIDSMNVHSRIITQAITYIQQDSKNIYLKKKLILKIIDFEIAYKLLFNFIELIGIRGILTMLGFRTTPGSCNGIILTRETLFLLFNTIYNVIYIYIIIQNRNGRTNITVGGRALSKHYDRNKDPFWFCNGTEENRNNQAIQVFNTILNDSVWWNIHYLPNNIKVLEIRNHYGYGMRWNYSGDFRGMLEPED